LEFDVSIQVLSLKSTLVC